MWRILSIPLWILIPQHAQAFQDYYFGNDFQNGRGHSLTARFIDDHVELSVFQVPKNLASLEMFRDSKVTKIYVENASTTIPVLSRMEFQQSLRCLILSDSQIDSKCVAWMIRSKKLEELTLMRCNMSDELFSKLIRESSSLVSLDVISLTALNDATVQEFAKSAKSLKRIHIDDSTLTQPARTYLDGQLPEKVIWGPRDSSLLEQDKSSLETDLDHPNESTTQPRLGISIPGSIDVANLAKRTNSLGMEFVELPSGNFQSGEDSRQRLSTNTGTVSITEPFNLGIYEVTWSQYRAVMKDSTDPFVRSLLKQASSRPDQCPAESLSWIDAKRFCDRLSEVEEEKKAGRTYRLPTAAEWEYACRAGSNTEYPFGNETAPLAAFGWYVGNSNGSSQPVGKKLPNLWGLYDMSGNVFEWCSDWEEEVLVKHDGSYRDPKGPESGTRKVYRGGSWEYEAEECRSSARHSLPPEAHLPSIGLRVVMELQRTTLP